MVLIFGLQTTASAQDAKFRVPLNGSYAVNCYFNSACASTNGGKHTGVDYSAANKDILAANAGRIVLIVSNGYGDHGLGNTLIIEHKVTNPQGGVETLYSQYSHLASFITGLYQGEAVVKGQKIGTMGGSGHGSVEWPVHLHFEIKRGAVISNPQGGNACTNGTSPCWGYTPSNAANYGYIDPAWFISSTSTASGNDYAYWNFTGAGNRESWSLINIEGWAVGNGVLFDDPRAVDPYIVSPDLYVDASVVRYLNIRIANNGLDGNLSVYFKTSADNTWSESKRVDFAIGYCAGCGNAPFRNYSIRLSGNTRWQGKILAFRIDPTTTGVNGFNYDTIGFDSIRLAPNSTLF
jgi:murein DD-endopeptidase MepM/ murein hydrolase activator NlpD